MPKKGVYSLKQIKWTVEFCIFRLVYVPSFSLNGQFLIFGPNLFKKGTYSLKQIK